jgi:hypothetical protein
MIPSYVVFSWYRARTSDSPGVGLNAHQRRSPTMRELHAPRVRGRSTSCAAEVLSGAGIYFYPLSGGDEKWHLDLGAGLQGGRFRTAG